MTIDNEKITYVNEIGETVIFKSKKPYILLEKKGFGGSSNNITSQKVFNIDGEIEDDETLPPRPLSISAIISGKNSTEDNKLRRNLLKVFNPKLNGTIIYESFGKTYEIDVKITEGWEDELDSATHLWKGTVSFLALYPLWRDTSSSSYTVQLGQTINEFSFPLGITDDFKFATVEAGKEVAVINPGHISVGMELNIECIAEVVNPRIYNPYTQEWFAFNWTFSGKDTIYLNTNENKKQVLINGENGFFKRKLGSKFLQISNLETNYFILEADKGVENMIAEMKYCPLLTGVC